MPNDVKRDLTGTLLCDGCAYPLKLNDKVIGLQQRRQYDVFWCPLCSRQFWLPQNSAGPGNKSAGGPEIIDGKA